MFTRCTSTTAAAIAVVGVLVTAAPAFAAGQFGATPRISHSADGYSYGSSVGHPMMPAVRPESRISQASLAALERAVPPRPSLSQTSLAALEHALPRATPVTPATLTTPTQVTPHMYLTSRAAPGDNGSGGALVALAAALAATLGIALLTARYLGTGTRKPQSA